ncbi:MAG: glycosyl transferase [Candidatus Latescibacterota bacterium]|nr:glycosyl transferase [Candidatus Latescibacterota bacterium]
MTVLLIAIVDDVRRPLKVREKLGLQGVAVGAWAMFGQSLEWQEVLGLPVWATFGLVILWLLGWMNVYNFMDGIDGITAVNTIACCGWLSAVLWVLESPIWWLPMLAVAAAAGFLLLNAPPARIFMGDVGSLNLGFITALFVLIAVQEGTPPAAALFIFGYYLYDGGSTLLRRMLRGENPTTRHREHLYQRLTQVGWTHLRVDGAVVVLSCLFGGAALTLAAGRMSLFGIVFAAAVASIAFLERTAAKYR